MLIPFLSIGYNILYHNHFTLSRDKYKKIRTTEVVLILPCYDSLAYNQTDIESYKT
nr:MAG TPA: hypothetical protein [Caudoviricetes sp.]